MKGFVVSLTPRWLGSVIVVILVLGSQVVVSQWAEITSLKRELRLAEKAKEIEGDQIRDLLYQLSQFRADADFAGNKQFVLGVVEAVTHPDRYNEVWHAGYDRGTANQKYVDESPTSGTTASTH